MAIANELAKLNIEVSSIRLGEVDLADKPDDNKLKSISVAITALGFELIENKTARIISQIKKFIVNHIHQSGISRKTKFSTLLAESIGKDYNFLSGIFSGVEGITIEQYLINMKIEKVKELLVYDELNLSEIASQLNYSSVQHLSTQFKKITGLTPTHFKQIGAAKRIPLDKV
jgi:AraC-like DNA-binding protein